MPSHPRSPHILEHVPLAPHTTLGVGGPARYYIEAAAESDAFAALEFASAGGWPLLVMGGGSNLLVSDAGFRGVVLHIALNGIRPSNAPPGLVTAAAGEDWDGFVAWCVDRGWAGLECLSGIPGTVGATPVQNVGAYGQDVSETIRSIRAIDRRSLEIVELSAARCSFAYRTSIFNTDLRDRFIILAVTFALRPGGSPRIDYADLKRWFAGRRGSASLETTREAVLSIRSAKGMVIRTQEPDSRSAGSFFKNPVVSADRALEVEAAAWRMGRLDRAARMPRYPAAGDSVKIPAAWLIERAGFSRGFSRGSVGLSSKHALAIINRGGATAGEILNLAREIQSRVRDLFGAELSLEPVLVGF